MTDAAARGWGPGWPNCQTHRWTWREAAGHRWLLREEAAPVLVAFIEAFHAEVERIDPAQSWSAVCRAIRGSDQPSNHSWALAVDFNSALHPMGRAGTFSAEKQRKIRALLARPAFRHIRWGADFSRPDDMHFEYVGTLADAADDAALLEDDDMSFTDADRALLQEAVAVSKKNGTAITSLGRKCLGWYKHLMFGRPEPGGPDSPGHAGLVELREQIAALPGGQPIDYDLLADKVVERLSVRLGNG